jgi:hypothetical protein
VNQKELEKRVAELEATNETLGAEVIRLSQEMINPYGLIDITTPDDPKVYPAKFGGGKSTVVANVIVPSRILGMKIKAAIYARLEESADGQTITIEPSLAAKVFAKLGDEFDGRGLFKSHVLGQAEKWVGWGKAEASAMARLSGLDKPVSAKPEMPVRLVKKVVLAKPEQPVAAPAA